MMKMCVLRVSILVVCFFAASPGHSEMEGREWKYVSSGIGNADLHSIAVCPSDPAVVYAGSYKVAYRTTDRGNTWTEILSLRGTDNGINTLAADPLHKEVIYAGTAKGLYRSRDQGLHWERIFQGVGGPENMIFAVFVNSHTSENIFIGTLAGIFFTEDGGRNWVRGQYLPAYSIITSISGDAYDPHILYAASARGIYKTIDRGIGWNRIHESAFDESALYNFIADDEEGMEEVDITEMRDGSHIRKIIPDPGDRGIIYAATPRGLLVTHNSGITWTTSGSIGLVSHNIRDIAISPGDPEYVYAATDRGIFRYSRNSDSWDELYKGIASSDIRCLAFARAEKNSPPVLWAITRSGVYKSSPSLASAVPQNAGPGYGRPEARDVLRMFDDEPSIEEIKEAAIAYAEVSPDKIREWRRAAAKRAWLPNVSMKYGSAKDWQSSSYFYSTRDEKYKDDDITDGKDSDWYISLTWNLGDLIWDDAQTSIDNRSKLMVQLRNDVLNEVTRLYFERRRFQIDLLMSSPGNDKEDIDNALRLQELTASIDALTGSFLSRRIAQKGIGAQRQE